MSVIVWDGETLASDMGVWKSGTVMKMRKILANEDKTRIVAFAGDVGVALRSAEMWLECGSLDKLTDSDVERGFELLCYSRESDTLSMYSDSRNEIALSPSQVVVCGHQFAAGAARALLHDGLTAQEVVRELSKADWCDVVYGGCTYVRTTRNGNPLIHSLL